jgi:chromosome segregation ATPase
MTFDRLNRLTLFIQCLLVCFILAACTSGSARPGDRYFDSERYVDAAEAYEEYLNEGIETREEEALTLFRLGLIYARNESSLYDPTRSVEMLSRYLEVDPSAPFELQARLILGLEQEVVQLRADVAKRKERIETLFSELSELQEQIERAKGQVGVREQKVETLSVQIDDLRQKIESLMREVEEKEVELERLKAIDFDSKQ